MSFLQRLLQILRRLFSSDRHELEEWRKRERNTLEIDNDRPKFELSIWQTENLTEKRGRMPEKMVAKYVGQAIEDAGYDYRIHYGYEQEFSPPREDNSTETFQWWGDNSPDVARTCNMILYDSRGGGRAGLGGRRAIVGMNRVDRVDENTTSPCESDACSNVWAAIHEFGHSLGGKHKTPMMDGKPDMLFSDNMKELIDERVDSGKIRTVE